MMVRKSLRRWLLGIAIAVLAVAFLAGCSSLPASPSASDASAVAGELKLNVSGLGTGDFSADATVHATYTWGAVIGLAGATSGDAYQATTTTPNGEFVITNVRPGQYTIQKLWCQVQTTNSWVTVSTSFRTPPSFTVDTHDVANLGVIEWNVSYDLTRPATTTSVEFVQDFSAVKGVIAQRVENTPWSGYDISEVSVNAEGVGPTSVVSTLMPRTGGHPTFQVSP